MTDGRVSRKSHGLPVTSSQAGPETLDKDRIWIAQPYWKHYGRSAGQVRTGEVGSMNPSVSAYLQGGVSSSSNQKKGSASCGAGSEGYCNRAGPRDGYRQRQDLQSVMASNQSAAEWICQPPPAPVMFKPGGGEC